MVKHIIGTKSHSRHAPSGSAEIFRVGIEADGVVRQHIHQRLEAFDECAIHIVGDYHQVGIVILNHIHQLVEYLLGKAYAWRVGGVGDANRLDCRIAQFVDLLLRVLPVMIAVFLNFIGADVDYIIIKLSKFRNLKIGSETRG